MKILVTGGAGFIGSHLVEALLAGGHQVRVVDALVSQVHDGQPPRYLAKEAEFIRGDVSDPAVLERALQGVEAIFHQAAEVGVGQSMYEIERYVRANTYGTALLLQALLKARIPQAGSLRKLVVASSMSIYGEGAYHCEQCGPVAPQTRPDAQLLERRWELLCATCGAKLEPRPTSETKPLFPSSIYAITKQDQEQLCLVFGRAYGIPTVALRYFNVYGTRQALQNPYTGVCAIFGSRLLNDRPPVIFEDGRQSRDFVHVKDIVRANVLALESSGADYQAVNVGTGVSTSVAEVARLLSGGLGKSIAPEMLGKYRVGDIRHCVADITRARQLLGYEPSVRLQDGIPELLAWVRQQSAEDRTGYASQELAQRNLVH